MIIDLNPIMCIGIKIIIKFALLPVNKLGRIAYFQFKDKNLKMLFFGIKICKMQ
jgi:hypothetical protein